MCLKLLLDINMTAIDRKNNSISVGRRFLDHVSLVKYKRNMVQKNKHKHRKITPSKKS